MDTLRLTLDECAQGNPYLLSENVWKAQRSETLFLLQGCKWAICWIKAGPLICLISRFFNKNSIFPFHAAMKTVNCRCHYGIFILLMSAVRRTDGQMYMICLWVKIIPGNTINTQLAHAIRFSHGDSWRPWFRIWNLVPGRIWCHHRNKAKVYWVDMLHCKSYRVLSLIWSQIESSLLLKQFHV